MNYIVGWQINTEGSSETLPIPSGFCIVCIISVQECYNNIYPDPKFGDLEVQVCTTKTNALTDVIHKNDDLEAQGFTQEGNHKVYEITSADLNSSVRALAKAKINADLVTAYGGGNVVDLPNV
jgi:hypothetical protein